MRHEQRVTRAREAILRLVGHALTPGVRDGEPARTRSRVAADVLLQSLLGETLEQVCFGADGLQLGFGEAGGVSLVRPVRLGAADLPETPLVEVLELLAPLTQDQASVFAISVDSTGTLKLTVGGVTLTCGSDPSYEAWNVTTYRGGPVVCLPGGELAVFE